MKLQHLVFIACLLISSMAVAARSREEMGVKPLQKKAVDAQVVKPTPDVPRNDESLRQDVESETAKAAEDKPSQYKPAQDKLDQK